MITKIGAGIIKEALFGTITGAVRAGKLTPEERRTLEKEYGLPEDAHLALRNAGRGLVGGNLGAMGGAVVSKLMGRKSKIPGLVSAVIGSKLMTDKYSSGNARKIMELNKKPDVPLSLIAQKIRESGLEGDAAKGLLAFYEGDERARKEAF